jgi:biopolymer transport protein TolQ
MDMIQDLSFIRVIANASLLVQLVMGLLLLVSLMSWWYIFIKMFTVRQAVKQSADLSKMHFGQIPISIIFTSG